VHFSYDLNGISSYRYSVNVAISLTKKKHCEKNVFYGNYQQQKGLTLLGSVGIGFGERVLWRLK
jgi:hypothetical protein